MCTDFRSASYSASQGKKVVVNSDIISYARTRTSSLSRRNWAPVMFCVRGSRNATVVSTVMGTEDVGCASGRIFEKIRVRLFSSIIEYPAPSRRGPIHIPEASFARTTGDGHVTTPLSLTHPSSKVGPPQHLRSHVNRLVLRDTPRHHAKQPCLFAPPPGQSHTVHTMTTERIATQTAWSDQLDLLDFQRLDKSMKTATEGNIAKRTRVAYESYLRQADQFIEAYADKRFANDPEYLEYRESFERPTSKSKDMILTFIHVKCLLGSQPPPPDDAPPSDDTPLATEGVTEGADPPPTKKRKVKGKAKGKTSKAPASKPTSQKKHASADGDDEDDDFYAEEAADELPFLPADPPVPENMPELPPIAVPDIPELQNEDLPAGGPSVARTIQAALRWRFLCRFRLVRSNAKWC